jgi:hypothetical protein
MITYTQTDRQTDNIHTEESKREREREREREGDRERRRREEEPIRLTVTLCIDCRESSTNRDVESCSS